MRRRFKLLLNGYCGSVFADRFEKFGPSTTFFLGEVVVATWWHEWELEDALSPSQETEE